MNLFALPFISQLYLPVILTSMILGMVILILLEKKRIPDKQEGTLRNSATSDSARKNVKTPVENSRTLRPSDACKDVKDGEESLQKDIGDSKVAKDVTESGIEVGTNGKTEEKDGQEESGEKEVTKDSITTISSSSRSSSSSCSSSGSEEEVSRPSRVKRQPNKKKPCKGSPIICASKRKVTAVTIVTDSTEDRVKVSLEDLAEEIRSQAVTCSVHPATTDPLPAISTEPSHLLLLFGTTSAGCDRLQDTLRTALGGDAALPPPQPFLYSVTCWADSASGDVYESARKLSSCLGGCGGAEWLPVTCITTDDEGQTEQQEQHQPTVMARQQYVSTVMDKITKPAKKCCGTSCGSKMVDIEDIASSLLLSRAAVTS